MDRDKFISVDVIKGQQIDFPNGLSAERDLTLQSLLDGSNLPEEFIRSIINSSCERRFVIGPKVTQKSIVKITNCQFPQIQGPFDGTVLEIDEISYNFTKERNGITGLVIKLLISQ